LEGLDDDLNGIAYPSLAKKISSVVLKIDLLKFYDKVNWGFLRLALIHMGMNLNTVNWIMGCIYSKLFVVLINGSPSSFFRPMRCLRQGCVMSHFLFLIIAEGLRKLIKNSKTKGLLKGIKVSLEVILTHLLFVDDVMIFGEGSVQEFHMLKSILELFFLATSMLINMEKSNMIICYLREELLVHLDALLHFNRKSIEAGIKYLGFELKPCGYLVDKWLWLPKKIQKEFPYGSYVLFQEGVIWCSIVFMFIRPP
jgi:hypothetical protein